MQPKIFITALLALLITTFSATCFATEYDENGMPIRDMSIKTVAVMPVISHSQIVYPELEVSLKQKLDDKTASLIKLKPNDFKYVTNEVIKDSMSSDMKLGKPFDLVNIRDFAEKAQADIVVCFVIEEAHSSTYFNFSQKYLNSSATIRLICFNARNQFYVDNTDTQSYNKAISAAGAIPTLGNTAADNLLKKATLKYEFGLIN